MPEMDMIKQETVIMGFDLAEHMGAEQIFAITAAFKAIYAAGIEKGKQLAAKSAPPAA